MSLYSIQTLDGLLTRTHKHTTSIHAAVIRHFTGLSYSRVRKPFVTTDESTYIHHTHGPNTFT